MPSRPPRCAVESPRVVLMNNAFPRAPSSQRARRWEKRSMPQERLCDVSVPDRRCWMAACKDPPHPGRPAGRSSLALPQPCHSSAALWIGFLEGRQPSLLEFGRPVLSQSDACRFNSLARCRSTVSHIRCRPSRDTPSCARKSLLNGRLLPKLPEPLIKSNTGSIFLLSSQSLCCVLMSSNLDFWLLFEKCTSVRRGISSSPDFPS